VIEAPLIGQNQPSDCIRQRFLATKQKDADVQHKVCRHTVVIWLFVTRSLLVHVVLDKVIGTGLTLILMY
jgi:hypothetical protein